ncbi:hypothetical protein JZ751_020248 [Albula glossodonta]|uniref:Uncharacterized protein n=1 Tax=Albula glossodonta TaxID=121402 RepID=A0A8T2MTY7_9TELE|nr:hypothetical protein JZ751_020248 [Albula glossodonta]
MTAFWRHIINVPGLCQPPCLLVKTNVRWQSAAASPQVQDFLNGAPHRKHPGVTALRCVSLPEELQRAALCTIHGERHTIHTAYNIHTHSQYTTHTATIHTTHTAYNIHTLYKTYSLKNLSL